MVATTFKVEKFDKRNPYVLLGNSVQGGVVFSFALYLGILCTQLWHMQMGDICVRALTYLSKWGGFLCSEKSEVCERCAHEKQHRGVTFGDSALLHPSKQFMEDGVLGVQLEVELECSTLIFLGCEDSILDPTQVPEVPRTTWFCTQLGC